MITIGQICITKFAGPTNYRPSRVIATIKGAIGTTRVTLSWDHALDGVANHEAAARACFDKFMQARKAYSRKHGWSEPEGVYEIFAQGYDTSDAYVWLASISDVQVGT